MLAKCLDSFYFHFGCFIMEITLYIFPDTIVKSKADIKLRSIYKCAPESRQYKKKEQVLLQFMNSVAPRYITSRFRTFFGK